MYEGEEAPTGIQYLRRVTQKIEDKADDKGDAGARGEEERLLTYLYHNRVSLTRVKASRAKHPKESPRTTTSTRDTTTVIDNILTYRILLHVTLLI